MEKNNLQLYQLTRKERLSYYKTWCAKNDETEIDLSKEENEAYAEELTAVIEACWKKNKAAHLHRQSEENAKNKIICIIDLMLRDRGDMNENYIALIMDLISGSIKNYQIENKFFRSYEKEEKLKLNKILTKKRV